MCRANCGRASSRSTSAWRLSGAVSSRNARAVAASGIVPFRSRYARRRKSASEAGAATGPRRGRFDQRIDPLVQRRPVRRRGRRRFVGRDASRRRATATATPAASTVRSAGQLVGGVGASRSLRGDRTKRDIQLPQCDRPTTGRSSRSNTSEVATAARRTRHATQRQAVGARLRREERSRYAACRIGRRPTVRPGRPTTYQHPAYMIQVRRVRAKLRCEPGGRRPLRWSDFLCACGGGRLRRSAACSRIQRCRLSTSRFTVRAPANRLPARNSDDERQQGVEAPCSVPVGSIRQFAGGESERRQVDAAVDRGAGWRSNRWCLPMTVGPKAPPKTYIAQK